MSVISEMMHFFQWFLAHRFINVFAETEPNVSANLYLGPKCQQLLHGYSFLGHPVLVIFSVWNINFLEMSVSKPLVSFPVSSFSTSWGWLPIREVLTEGSYEFKFKIPSTKKCSIYFVRCRPLVSNRSTVVCLKVRKKKLPKSPENLYKWIEEYIREICSNPES